MSCYLTFKFFNITDVITVDITDESTVSTAYIVHIADRWKLTTEHSLFDRQCRNETIDVRQNKILSNQRENVPCSNDNS